METGQATPLISRLLNRYDFEELRQLGLFDEEETTGKRFISVEDAVQQVPPYNWTE